MSNPTRSELIQHRLLMVPTPAFLLTVIFLSLCLGSAPASAVPYLVNVNTASLNGAQGQLAFDFFDGGPPTNSVTISSFSTDGTLGSSSITGDVSGSLPGTVTLNDTAFTNEYLSGITLGTFLSFVFEATGNPPAPGSSPDGFAFYLLDQAGSPITTTGDPSGTQALLGLDITGTTTQPTPYSGSTPSVPVTVGPVNNSVPEPSSVALVLPGLLLLMRRGKTASV